MTPEENAKLVEEFRTTRADRQALNKHAELLERKEKALKTEIIAGLLAGGPFPSSVTLITKNKPTVTDWPKLWAHIAKTGEFDLLQKRITETAWQARLEDGTSVPGVQAFPVHDIKA